MAEDEDQLYVFHPSPIMALPPCPGEELAGEGGEVEVSLTAAEQQNGEEPNVNEDGTILSACVVCVCVRAAEEGEVVVGV